MRNRKTIFALAIAVLILILGVGYAVVSTQTLNIQDATVTAKTEAIKVVYTGVTSSSNSGEHENVTTLSANRGTTTATFAIENMVLNTPEYAVFEIVNNETDVNAIVHAPTSTQFTNTNSAYFDAKIYYKGLEDADFTEWTSDKTLEPGKTAEIKVIVVLKATPVTTEQSTTTINVTYTADPVAS